MHRNVLSLLMHLSMVGFTFHIVPGADVGERRRICCQNLPPGIST